MFENAKLVFSGLLVLLLNWYWPIHVPPRASLFVMYSRCPPNFHVCLLGVYQQYTETSRYGDTHNRQWWSEWYGQDTWQITPRFTLDYGLRFLLYTPYWRPDQQVSNFELSAYNPANAPRLYQPALVNGTRVALDPVTGQTLNAIYIGAYVAGTGNQANGLVLQTDPSVPKGFRSILAPQTEPRVGFTWDLSGGGRIVLHSSAGIFHNARLGGGSAGNLRNPPYILNPIIFYNTMSTTFVPGVTLANRPGTLEALETDYKTPSSYNWSVGIRRELGWGTSVDATYAGSVGRNLEMYYDLNAVPDGTRFLDQNPSAHDPGSTSPTAVLPPEFLRPISGYQNIRVRGNSGTSDYHALQVQVNRRYIHGVQFGGAYTLQRARGLADEDPGNLSIALDRLEAYNVLNSVQFQDIDRTARFDPAGNQINPNFGTAIGIATPTRPPRVLQMSVRFNF